jgi:branched-subunit amino acid permease
VAWSAVASNLRSAAHAPTAHLSPAAAKAAQTAAANHAIAHGFSQGYVVSAAIALLALVIALVTIRIKREDLAEVDPMAAPVG